MARRRAAAAIAFTAAVLAGLGLGTRPAHAELNTEDLVNMCMGHTGNPDVGIAMCNMYIAGVTDMHFYLEYETGQRFFCVKETNLTSADVRKLYLDWVKKNPKMIHQSARYTLLHAMISAFPCKGDD